MGTRRTTGDLPGFSRFGFGLFSRYLRGYFRRSFHAVRTSGALPDLAGQPEKPLVVYSNHPSWWDPIHFALLSSIKAPERAIYGPMDAEALEKYRFMKRLGVFGVARNQRGAAVFLRTALGVLGRPRASLWLTAEGTFSDARRRPLRILPGLAHLARRLEDAWVVPLAVEYPMWNERRPEALSRFGSAFDLATEPPRSVDEWTAALEQRLEATLDSLATDAQQREPAPFETLIAGEVGVSRVYDAWRRLGALLRGQRFSAAHDDPRPR